MSAREYVFIVRYDDGRKPDVYHTPDCDPVGLYRQRFAEGKRMPVGSCWGTHFESWFVTPFVAVQLSPTPMTYTEFLSLREQGVI